MSSYRRKRKKRKKASERTYQMKRLSSFREDPTATNNEHNPWNLRAQLKKNNEIRRKKGKRKKGRRAQITR
ncbi:hypothetical protein H5410_048833 [Solanum commersonii]|uniref:Uncharacterized protein n=1 Tax=Solanum commersonii TaxID=4109 RepID=A0A9J5XLN9_SOLCO|nr:hypothetical protein H5410_048833 [Solanum commersonii]